MHSPTPSNRSFRPDPLALGALAWLASGGVLLGLTPLPLYAAAGGWSLAFWLLVAPLTVLVARRLTRTPRAGGARGQPRRHAAPRSRGPRQLHAATPRRLASIRRKSSRMMRR